MSQTLEQIQIDFVANEDRLLLKLRSGNQLYRAWLTRRFIKLWVPILQGVHPQTGERFADTPALPLEQADAIQPVEDTPLEKQAEAYEYPLGEAPILAVEITYNTASAEKPAQMIIKPASGQGIVLPYQPQLNHTLLKLLQTGSDKAQWDLHALFHAEAEIPGGRLQ